jgi:transposase
MSNIVKLDFKGKVFNIGLDVHNKNWSVSIRQDTEFLTKIHMDPDPETLLNYMTKHYPGGVYRSVYEAGYCGFWIDRRLKSLGIQNIVTNPADIPTGDKERRQKEDGRDANKLSRERASNSLEAIYVPDEYHESLRSLCRLRERVVSHQTRLKNRIKAFLALRGIVLPENYECQHWSARFMKYLTELSFQHKPEAATFSILLRQLENNRKEQIEILKLLRNFCNEDERAKSIIKCLLTVPGVGFKVSVTFYSEIIDMNRFRNNDRLNCFIGFSPATSSSGEKEKVVGITPRKSKHLRYLLIEAAWIAIRKDPALLLSFNELSRRMPRNKAIIRIAKKLVSRMRHVWIQQDQYVTSLIK